MEPVADGVHRVAQGHVSAFLVDGYEGLVLIDIGLPRRHGVIGSALSHIGEVLFVGDAAMSRGGASARGFVNRATPAWQASIAHIADHDFETAVFGHAGPIRSASGAFARFAASL